MGKSEGMRGGEQVRTEIGMSYEKKIVCSPFLKSKIRLEKEIFKIRKNMSHYKCCTQIMNRDEPFHSQY